MPLWLPVPPAPKPLQYASTVVAAPTGLNPVVSNRNSENPWWAAAGSGGGGGSNNPNPSFSTISMPSSAPIITPDGSIALSNAAVVPGNVFNLGSSGYQPSVGNYGGIQQFASNGAGGSITFGDGLGANSALTLINYPENALPNVSTVIYGNTTIPTLQVNTINGTPYVPGGSVPADLTVSTLKAFPGTDPQSRVTVGAGPNNVVAVQNGSTLQSYIDLDLRDANGVNTALSRTNLINSYGVTTVYSENAGANFKGSIAILSSINNSLGGVKLQGQDGSYLQVGSNQIEAFSQDGTTLLVGPGTVQVSGLQTPGITGSGFLNVYSPTLIEPLISTGGSVSIVNTATATPTDLGFFTNSTAQTGNPANGMAFFSPNSSNSAFIAIDDRVNGQMILNGFPMVALQNSASFPNIIQNGYAEDFPYGSTILFTVPYSTDSVVVQLTPTNRNTSGGANPNCSLNNGYGPNGTGVSSIGFSVDTRNGGVGYNGSFFWTAMPRTY